MNSEAPAARALHRQVADLSDEGAPLVRLRGLTRDFGPFRAVHPMDLTIERGDFVSILGPSGCGKTTLLRMLGGFVRPSAGSIEIDGRDVTHLPPERRSTNMVFQGYGLFPHMSVRQNVGYGLRMARLPKREVADRVAEMIDLVQLGPLAERRPSELSGGQQQRVALARALVMRPKVLLLDEPFAALDLQLRKSMQDEMRRLHQTIGGTFVFVTHDQTEAMALANRIVVMAGGRVEQVGDAEEVYLRPANHFVSTFVGDANFIQARRTGGRIDVAGAFAVDAPGPDGAVEVGIRPERVRLGPASDGARYRFRGRVLERMFLGAYVRYRLSLPDGGTLIAHTAETGHAPGAEIDIGWSDQDQWLVTT